MIVNTAQGGGGSAKLNVYCQPDLPTDKFDGILLQTPTKETLKKVIFDDNPWAAGQWQNPSLVADAPCSVQGICEYNGEIYFIRGANTTDFYKFNPTSNAYTKLADLPYAAFNSVLIPYNGLIYLFFFSSTHHETYGIYNISSNIWDNASSPYGLSGVLGCRIDNLTYLFGGFDTYSSTGDSYYSWIFNLDNHNWAQLPNLPDRRSTGVAIPYNNKVYLFGGSVNGNDDRASNTCLYYDITAQTYTSIANLPAAIDSFGGVLVGTKANLFGGYNGAFQNTIYVYNFDTGIFSTGPTMPKAIPCLAESLGNSIYVFNVNTADVPEHFMLTSKQYDYSPAMVIHRLQHDTTLQAILSQSKLCDGIPTNFKDAMLFKDGNLTFPALYVGNGTQWIKEREAQ